MQFFFFKKGEREREWEREDSPNGIAWEEIKLSYCYKEIIILSGMKRD